MLRNWFTVAVRNLAKHRLHAAINILGLAVGLASCIVIILFVRDEVSYDRWIPDAQRIYRIHTRYDFPGRAPLVTTSSASPVAPALLQDHPQEIETATRVMALTPIVRRGSDIYFERGQGVDTAFFKVFDLPLVEGDKATALSDPSAIVLNERLAGKYFNGRRALGETLTLTYGRVTRDMRVTGVIKDLPTNSSLEADFLIPLNEQDIGREEFPNWGAQIMESYIKLKPAAAIGPVIADLGPFLKRHVKDQEFMSLSLMALPDLHLRAAGGYSATAPTRERIVAAFSVVAALILAIASINFMNLATARATQRAREVALRKVVGAHRRHLIIQFIGESLLVATIALMLALVMVESLLPALNGLLQKQMQVRYFGGGSLLPYLLALVGMVGVFGGTYPAFYLSSFQPARILKPAVTSKLTDSVSARQVLVVVQFVISIALIICTAVVYQQTSYMRRLDLGFARDGLLVVRELMRPAAASAADTLRQEISKIPGVTGVALSGSVPTDDNNIETSVRKPGTADAMTINLRIVDYGFFATYGVPLLAGREFSGDHAGDDIPGTNREAAERGGNVILSRGALSRFGFSSPEAAIGQPLLLGTAPMTIVGVVADMQFRSARDELPPTLFMRRAAYFQNLSVRFSGIGEAQARSAVEAVWRKLVPGVPFSTDFMTALVDKQYRAEQAQGTMFTTFSGLAVIVAGLGLFGLAAFTAERRTKEIGLRKVLGARVPDILRLLLWQFSQPVVAANLIAWPIAYLVMHDWLNGFEFRIGLSPLYFLGAGAAALVIAWVTIFGHAFKVARAKPIIALRYE
ncbi:MAG: ABC transporter permease [Rhodospirillaceae bacterium]